MDCPACGNVNLPGADACEECMAPLTQLDIPRATTKIEHSMMFDEVQTLHIARPITVAADAPLREAVETMRSNRIGCVLATGAGGKLAGILTERDLLFEVAGQEVDLDAARVSDYMTPDPETLKPHNHIAFALHHMMIGEFRHLPLVDDEGRPAGMVSSRDIINYIEGHFHETVTKRYTRRTMQEKLKRLAGERAEKEE